MIGEIVTLFIIAVVVLLVGYSLVYGITPTPTSRKVKKKLLEVTPPLTDGPILELGSGWGTLAFALARHYPSCPVIAYEISPIPFLVSKILQKIGNYPNLTIKREDFFKVSFAEANLIVCYLYPGAMVRLRDKFQRELKPNTPILSNTFAIPGIKPILCARADDLYKTPIYIYKL